MNRTEPSPAHEWNTSENPALLRPNREMVRSRTLQLATNASRGAHQIRQSDYEQAKRELTGESDFDRQQSILDARWG